MFLAAFGIVFVFLMTRNKERMAMIEKGTYRPDQQPKSRSGLKFGLIAIGVAIGILTGNFLSEYTVLGEESAYFSMIFLFGGLGFVVHHVILKKELEQKA